MTDDPTPDTYGLPPTQSLVLEVLAARFRLGETHWTFAANHRAALRGLSEAGLIGWKAGIIDRTLLAWLTEEGRKRALSRTWRSPAVRLLEEALHLRMNGERAPGGNESWHGWDLDAEEFLRSLLPPEPEEAGS